MWRRCSSHTSRWRCRSGAGDILYAASSRGPTVYTTFLASRDSIRRNRAAFDAMVRATRRTLTWVAEHSAEELADAVAPFYPHVAREHSGKLAISATAMRDFGRARRRYRGRDSRGLPTA